MFLRAWLAALALSASVTAAESFVPLFNGRDLEGWVNVNSAPDTWQATNGVIYCTGVPIGELRTRRMYQNFVLELEWRHLKAGGNAGVFVWADALTARGQPFIRGVEVQVLDGREGPGYTSDGDIFPIHGARMVPLNGRGGDRAFPTQKRMRPSPEWNHYRIECVDGRISLAVNGEVVTRGHSASPRKGYLCLESEGSPVEFRNLRLRELPAATALDPVDIADPDDHFVPLYTGVDLAGWRTEPAPSWKVNDWILTCAGMEKGVPLVSAADYGDGTLIFDWRWSAEGRAGDWTQLVRLRGVSLAGVLNGRGAAAERPVGEWNRAVLRLRGRQLTVAVNGREILPATPLADIPPRGRLELGAPPVPAEVANLFWKTLD